MSSRGIRARRLEFETKFATAFAMVPDNPLTLRGVCEMRSVHTCARLFSDCSCFAQHSSSSGLRVALSCEHKQALAEHVSRLSTCEL